MVDLVKNKHESGGHFKREMVKLELMDKYYGTRVNQAIVKAINDYRRCKNFTLPTGTHNTKTPLRAHGRRLPVHVHGDQRLQYNSPDYRYIHLLALGVQTENQRHSKNDTGRTDVNMQPIQYPRVPDDEWQAPFRLQSCLRLLQSKRD